MASALSSRATVSSYSAETVAVSSGATRSAASGASARAHCAHSQNAPAKSPVSWDALRENLGVFKHSWGRVFSGYAALGRELGGRLARLLGCSCARYGSGIFQRVAPPSAV